MRAPPDRNKLLARVHCLKRDLGLDEDTYRAMLRQSFGVDSAGELKPTLLLQLVRTLERGAGQSRRRAAYPGRPHNIQPKDEPGETSRSKQLRKIEALLAEAGRPWEYADALSQRICKAERVAWVADSDLHKLIAALTRDAERHGRRTR